MFTEYEQDLLEELAEEECEEEEEGEELLSGEEEEEEDRGDDTDDEEEEEASGEEEEEGPVKYVPYSRFKQSIDKTREMQSKLEQAEEERRMLMKQLQQRGEEPAKQKEEATFDFEAKEKEKYQAIADGEFDKAAVLEREIRQAEMDQFIKKAERSANSHTAQQLAEQELNMAAKEVMEDYPFLDVNSAESDEDAIDEVVALRDYFINNKNMRPGMALREAANRVGPRYQPVEGDSKDEEGTKEKQKQSMKRKKRALDQPAKPGGKGERSGETDIDPEKMPEDEFKSLSKKDKAKLRGDFVE